VAVLEVQKQGGPRAALPVAGRFSYSIGNPGEFFTDEAIAKLIETINLT
jgi:hypothetical protein